MQFDKIQIDRNVRKRKNPLRKKMLHRKKKGFLRMKKYRLNDI